MSNDPIPRGRRVALDDDSLWLPLKGAPAAIMARLGLSDAEAGDLLSSGMQAGLIGHKEAWKELAPWVVSPVMAALVKRAGIDYTRDINWRRGTITGPTGLEIDLLVYWPDVERLARRPSGLAVGEDSAPPPPMPFTRQKPGPKGNKTTGATSAMLQDLREGRTSATRLQAEKQEVLASVYNVGRTAAVTARKEALSQFNSGSNSDK